ncbi:MAG: 1-deoxy-D-xylulose-5-phosphate synthase [Lachnospiraceae bacterium]|nr:1-deoxy-D-xylulose-5-phosphate synthase [Lachnospiraceae bacterium]
MGMLEQIKEPNDIKKIKPDSYDSLAEEIRSFLLEHVSQSGGHLASNLGVVELTMALHLAMDFPKDKLIFDVGHQSYTHKILTGRKEQFDTLRQLDGMSGFPKTHESSCDTFNTGHSSTSISAALGIAKARDIKGTKEKIVAVIGDGALTGGMAFEALNNMANLKSNCVIVLNDNEMSISENVGAMSKYLSDVRVGKAYNEFKVGVEKTLRKIPKVGDNLAKTVKRSKDSIKQLFVPGMFFEDMGITYVGPIDGHDIEGMVETFQDAFLLERPILVHVMTKKGKGYRYAEKYPSHFHGVEPFEIESGKSKAAKKQPSYTGVFAKKMLDYGEKYPNLVAITAAMPDGTGLQKFKEAFPERFFDVGIAEEHAVTFAAGMAAAGMKPVVAIYSSFLQRAYDQILHDVCLQNLPVVFAVDRSGLVGADGETHQGIFDTAYLNSIPNLTVLAPKNKPEMKAMLDFAMEFQAPIAIKYPRGEASLVLAEQTQKIRYGKGEVIEQGREVAILSVGNMMDIALYVTELLKEKGVKPTLVNVRFIKPYDKELLMELRKEHSLIVTLEESVHQGSFGQSVNSFYMEQGIEVKVQNFDLKDQFIEQGKVDELRNRYGLESHQITDEILNRMKDGKKDE